MSQFSIYRLHTSYAFVFVVLDAFAADNRQGSLNYFRIPKITLGNDTRARFTAIIRQGVYEIKIECAEYLLLSMKIRIIFAGTEVLFLNFMPL